MIRSSVARQSMARAAGDRAAQARGDQLKPNEHPKKARPTANIDVSSVCREAPGIWPSGWLCGALGVSRGGFYACYTTAQSAQPSDESWGQGSASFLPAID